jgi:hypothetical protein
MGISSFDVYDKFKYFEIVSKYNDGLLIVLDSIVQIYTYDCMYLIKLCKLYYVLINKIIIIVGIARGYL